MPLVKLNKTEYGAKCFSDFVRGELARKRTNQAALADYMSMDRTSVSKKLTGKVAWTLPEMVLVCGFFGTEYTVRG